MITETTRDLEPQILASELERARRVTIEHSIIGIMLLVVGISGLAVGFLSADARLVLGFFVLGLVLSVLRRHYTGIDDEDVSNAPELPSTVHVDRALAMALRVSPLLVVGTALIVLAHLLGYGLAGALGGLTTGQGLVELQPALWFRRWERENGRQVFAASPRVFYYPKNAVPAIYLRTNETDLRATETSRPGDASMN